MIAVETRNLTRKFGKVIAVESLDLVVPDGSLYGLIGPNGAGKTTTLRMLAGLLEPTAGEILIQGESYRAAWGTQKRLIGYMPDFFGVYDDLLVWEYLDFFARCHRLPTSRRERVVDELLELVDLGSKRDAQVQTLSRGMKQRLCLAHALVHDPQILLLDEPASGLDPRARVEMRELLRELSSMGKTIILSSHILAELAELCDSIGIIERGRLVFNGSLDTIRSEIEGKRRLQIQVLSDLEAAENFLQDQPLIHSWARLQNGGRENVIEVEMSGDDEAVADLLEALVAERVRMSSFTEIKTDLEDIFMSLTKGETA